MLPSDLSTRVETLEQRFRQLSWLLELPEGTAVTVSNGQLVLTLNGASLLNDFDTARIAVDDNEAIPVDDNFNVVASDPL